MVARVFCPKQIMIFVILSCTLLFRIQAMLLFIQSTFGIKLSEDRRSEELLTSCLLFCRRGSMTRSWAWALSTSSLSPSPSLSLDTWGWWGRWCWRGWFPPCWSAWWTWRRRCPPCRPETRRMRSLIEMMFTFQPRTIFLLAILAAPIECGILWVRRNQCIY